MNNTYFISYQVFWPGNPIPEIQNTEIDLDNPISGMSEIYEIESKIQLLLGEGSRVSVINFRRFEV